MISLNDDSAEPDYEALTPTEAEVQFWTEIFGMFKTDTAEPDETDH